MNNVLLRWKRKAEYRRRLVLIDKYPNFMHGSCMATKTISLEIDAYEKLKAAKKGSESFSSVVRRCVLPDCPMTGRALLDFHRSRSQFLSEEELVAVEQAEKKDTTPASPWEEES